MSSKVEFNCLPTAIGSMPHADPKLMSEQVKKDLKLIIGKYIK